MYFLLLAALVGFAVADLHCTNHTSCQSFCRSGYYGICKSGEECKCMHNCVHDSDCNSDRTYDLTGHHCSHDTHYCLRGVCHCGSDHLATFDGTCPHGHTAECHNVICAFATHLTCVSGICSCRSDVETGGCLSSSDCHTQQGCPKTDMHCIDRQCKCMTLSATQNPACTAQSDCSIPNCAPSDVHCMDGNCTCLAQATTAMMTTVQTTLATSTGVGLPTCRNPTDCSLPSTCKDVKNLHCIDGYCICL